MRWLISFIFIDVLPVWDNFGGTIWEGLGRQNSLGAILYFPFIFPSNDPETKVNYA